MECATDGARAMDAPNAARFVIPLAAALLIGASVFILRRSGKGEPQQQKTAADDQEPAANEGPDDEPEEAISIEPHANNNHCEAERAHWQREERVWKHQTWAAWAMLVVTGVASVGGLAGFFILRDTLRATRDAARAARRSADTARQQLELSERPWIDAEYSVTGPFEIGPDGHARASAGAVLVNIGHSVAVDVQIFGVMIPEVRHGFYVDIRDETGRACEEAATLSEVKPRIARTYDGDTIFPGARLRVEIPWLLIDARELADPQIPTYPDSRRYVLPLIVGCIIYRFSFDPENTQHQTRFALYLRKKPNGATPVPLRSRGFYMGRALEIKTGSVPGEELALEPAEGHGFAN